MPPFTVLPLEPAYQKVDLSSLDMEDHSFIVSFGFKLQPLVDSIQQIGLLTMPLVRCRSDGRRQVICGYKRALALKSLSIPAVGVLEVPDHTSDAACLLASLYDNALGRGFNPVEQAALIDRLMLYWDQSTVIRDFFPLLKIPPSNRLLQRYRRLQTLERPFLELVASEQLNLEAAAKLGDWPGADRAAILPFLARLPWSLSKQLELIENLFTLSRRQGTTPGCILESAEVQAIFRHKTLTAVQKVSQLREQLRLWCFPRLSSTEKKFTAHLKSLGLHQQPDLRLVPSPNFESPVWRLEIEFQNPVNLAQRLAQLLELTTTKEFQDLTQL